MTNAPRRHVYAGRIGYEIDARQHIEEDVPW